MTRDPATELRMAFDRAFAEAPPSAGPPHIELLRVTLGGAPHVLVLSEIFALHADLRITAVPSRRPELLGVASVRGAIVPVYDLRLAVGVAAVGAPRWTVLVAGGSAGLAFEGFAGHARIVASALATATGSSAIRGSVELGGQRHAVVNLEVVTAMIRKEQG